MSKHKLYNSGNRIIKYRAHKRSNMYITLILFISVATTGCMGFHHTDTYVEELFEEKKYEEITSRFSLVLMLEHEKYDDVYMLAYSYYSLEKYEDALSTIDTIIDKKDDFIVRKLKYDTLYDMGEYDKAEEFLNEILNGYEETFDTIDMESKMEYCYFLVSASRNHKAIQKYKTLISEDTDPYYLDLIYNNMAWAYINIDDYENAVIYCKKSLEISPDDSITLLNLARSYQKLDNIEEAEQAYRDAYSSDHDRITALYELGTLLQNKDEKDIDELIQLWEAYTTLDPTNENGWINLYEIYIEASMEEKSIVTLKKIVDMVPDYSDYVQLLLKYYDENGDTTSYDNLLVQYRLETSSTEVDNLIALYTYKYKSHEEGLKLMADILEENKEYMWSSYNLIETMYLDNDESFDDIINLVDEKYGSDTRMDIEEELYYDYDDSKGLKELAYRMIEKNGESSYAYEILGDISYYDDQYKDAYDSYTKALTLGESMEYVQMNLLDCEISLKLIDDAIGRLSKISEQNDSPILNVHKARIEYLSGNENQAIDDLILAIKESGSILYILDDYEEIKAIKDNDRVLEVIEEDY